MPETHSVRTLYESRYTTIRRYFAASVLALAADVGGFSFAMRILEWTWPVAATLGFLLGACVAYAMSVAWVFKKRALRDHPLVELIVFVAIGVLGLGVTQVVLWAGIEHLGLPAEAAKMVAAGCTFASNYAARKAVLFSLEEFQIPGTKKAVEQ
ncbi:MAG: GtrA family protein [Variovorax sp.]|nr:GtrA family protein [Variovorax sp.]